MKNLFVTFEQALELKELGFNEECLGLYHSDGELVIKKTKSQEQYHGQICTAPLRQQALSFIRNKYHVEFAVAKIHNESNDYHFHIDYEWYFSESTYEETENACLNKLIELIKK